MYTQIFLHDTDKIIQLRTFQHVGVLHRHGTPHPHAYDPTITRHLFSSFVRRRRRRQLQRRLDGTMHVFIPDTPAPASFAAAFSFFLSNYTYRYCLYHLHHLLFVGAHGTRPFDRVVFVGTCVGCQTFAVVDQVAMVATKHIATESTNRTIVVVLIDFGGRLRVQHGQQHGWHRKVCLWLLFGGGCFFTRAWWRWWWWWWWW